MKFDKEYLLALIRIALGLIFLWAFFDKLFGFGFPTVSNKAWSLGNSPTEGFLKYGTAGPFSNIFQALAENVFVDWLFMFGLLGIGLTLLLGICMNIGTIFGAFMMLLMWLAHLPPQNHPFLDEHIIYLIVLLVLRKNSSGDFFGFGKWWKSTKIVKRFSILE